MPVLILGSQMMETEMTSRRLSKGTNCSLAQLSGAVGLGCRSVELLQRRGSLRLLMFWRKSDKPVQGTERIPLVGRHRNHVFSRSLKPTPQHFCFGLLSALLSLQLLSVWSSPGTTSALTDFQSFCLFAFSQPVLRVSPVKFTFEQHAHLCRGDQNKEGETKGVDGFEKEKAQKERKGKIQTSTNLKTTTKKPSKTVKTQVNSKSPVVNITLRDCHRRLAR